MPLRGAHDGTSFERPLDACMQSRGQGLVADQARVPVRRRVAHHLLVVPVRLGVLGQLELLQKLARVRARRDAAAHRDDHRLLRLACEEERVNKPRVSRWCD